MKYVLNLDAILLKRKMTPADLIRLLVENGEKATNVRKWVHGTAMPRGNQIAKLYEVLDLKPGKLFRVSK